MFGWLKAVANRITGTNTQGISLVANWLAGALWLIETKFLALAQRGYGQNEVVYACLRLLSQSVPEAPMVVYQKIGEGDRTAVTEGDNPLVALIERPNELMTEYEFWEMTTLHMGLVGRATWFKERDRAGQVIALWPLRPDRVGPIYSASQEEGQQVISGYSYLVPGTSQYISIPRRDILAFNFPDPAGESGGIVEGLGPLSVLARQVAADNKATDFVGALLANYAAPTVALKIKRSLQLAEATVIKQKFRSEFGGSNQGMVSILDADAEIEQLGFNLQQLEFPDIRRLSESRIAAAFGVPAVLVGLSAGLEAATYNNVAGMRRYFAETTLANYWRRYADQFQNDVAIEFGEDLVVEFDTSRVKALAGQREEAIAPVKEAFEKGAVTRNEYRLALGLEPVDGGDVFLVPATMLETMAFVGEPIGKAVTVKGLLGYRNNGHGGNGYKHLAGQHDQSSHAAGGRRRLDNGGVSGATAREFGSQSEGKEFLDGHYGEWRKGLSKKEDMGMTFYQSPGYELMNGHLRGMKVNAPEKDMTRAKDAISGLDSAIKRAPPLTEATVVYRGFSANQFDLKAGALINDKGYVSTALTKDQAGAFVNRGNQALARITIPKGTRAAGGAQKELVLPRGSLFQVMSTRKRGKITEVEMELVP